MAAPGYFVRVSPPSRRPTLRSGPKAIVRLRTKLMTLFGRFDGVAGMVNEQSLSSPARPGQTLGGQDELSRLKLQFLASLNHEIRTPLTGILGMTDLLLETALNEEQRE